MSEAIKGKVPLFGVRYFQGTLMFFVLTIAIGIRTTLPVGIVAMTDNTTSSNPDIPTYDWTNKSVILSSFYWTYFILQVVGAFISHAFSTKKIIVVASSVNSVACLLVPLAAAKFGSYGVMACRMLQGLSQGPLFPAVFDLVAKWAPLQERSRFASISMMGFSCGIIVTQPIVGYISSSYIGWPTVFYLFGALGIFSTIVWWIYGSDSPSVHKTISVEERIYIEESLISEATVEFKDIPFKAILTSVPMWAILVAYVGQVWITITLITELPEFLNKVMEFDVASDGVISSLSDVCGFLAYYPTAYIADYLIEKRYISVTNCRKWFTFISCTSLSVCAVILGYLPKESKGAAIFLLAFVGIIVALNSSGSLVNGVDLSPRYAGIIMGLTNGISMMIAPIAPLTVQALVTDETDVLQWRNIFNISSIVSMATTIFYMFFASGDVQWWDSFERGSQKDDEDDAKKTSIVSYKY